MGLLLILLAGCPAKRPATEQARRRLPLHEIEVIDRTAPEDRVPGLTTEVLRSRVRQRLAGSAAVALLAKPREDAYRLRLEVGIGARPRGGDGIAERVILLSARASDPRQLEGVDLQASAMVPVRWKPAAGRDRQRMLEAVDAVLDDLLFQAGLVVASGEQLARALTNKDTNRLAPAVEIAAARREGLAVPRLIELLRHREERIADRAIGALAAIRDPRAVRALTRLVDLRDTAHLAKILDAIGTIGGQEAKEYLEFVASGHEDADIRNLAAEALERLKRQEPKK